MLVEELFTTYFSDFRGPSYNFEIELFGCSIKYVIDSIIKSNLNSAELWIQVFSRIAIMQNGKSYMRVTLGWEMSTENCGSRKKRLTYPMEEALGTSIDF
ncbi:MAG: hypothetical protein V3V84_03375 [Candidatus Bathyarchaeia archaeon]